MMRAVCVVCCVLLAACGGKEEDPAPATGATSPTTESASEMGASAMAERDLAPAEEPATPTPTAMAEVSELSRGDRRRTQREATAAFAEENFAVAFARYKLLADATQSDPRLFCKAGYAAQRAGDTDNATTYLLRGMQLHARTLNGDEQVRRGRAMCLYNYARLIEDSNAAGARQALSESLRLRDNRTVREKLEALGGEPEAPLVSGNLAQGSRADEHAGGNVRVAFARYPYDPDVDDEIMRINSEVLFQIKEGERWRTQVVGFTVESSRERDAEEEATAGTSIPVTIGGRDFIAIRWSMRSQWGEYMESDPEVVERDGVRCEKYDEFSYDQTDDYLALCPVDGRDRCRRLVVGETKSSHQYVDCNNDGDAPDWAGAAPERSAWEVALEFDGDDLKLRTVRGTPPRPLRRASIPLSTFWNDARPAPRPVVPWTGEIDRSREGLRR